MEKIVGILWPIVFVSLVIFSAAAVTRQFSLNLYAAKRPKTKVL